MSRKVELEERWVEAWSALAEIVGSRWDVCCLLPDGTVVSVEKCKAWLQDSAYGEWRIDVKEGWVLGKRGIVVSRWRPDGNHLPSTKDDSEN